MNCKTCRHFNDTDTLTEYGRCTLINSFTKGHVNAVKSDFGCIKHEPYPDSFKPVFSSTNGSVSVELEGFEITIKAKNDN